jgi:hypothetical protein
VTAAIRDCSGNQGLLRQSPACLEVFYSRIGAADAMPMVAGAPKASFATKLKLYARF